jgi:hypothetical protein
MIELKIAEVALNNNHSLTDLIFMRIFLNNLVPL